MRLLAILLLASLLAPGRSKKMAPLGESFYLPGANMLEPLRVGGVEIFKDLPDECFQTVDGLQTVNTRSTFANIDTFYSKLSIEAGLSSSMKGAFTMGATMGVMTGSMSFGKTDVRGTSIDVFTVVKKNFLVSKCYRSDGAVLDPEFLEQLDKLPLEVPRPEYRASWMQYETFMERFGSHFIYEANYGSLLRWWTFSEQKIGYSERQLQAKSCLDFTGSTTPGAVSVEPCLDISSEELKASGSMTTSKYMELLGGTSETRSALLSQRTDELLQRLMNEGKGAPYPIQYSYLPVWKIIAMKFPQHKERFAKSMNMRQFYEGLLDFGCSLVEGNAYIKPLRIFRPSPDLHNPLMPAFECWLERDGCHSDADCHLFGFTSFCYGRTAVEHVEPSEGLKATEARIRSRRTGDHNEYINRSCYMPMNICNTEWSHSKAIWKGLEYYNEVAAEYAKKNSRVAAAFEEKSIFGPDEFRALYEALPDESLLSEIKTEYAGWRDEL